MRILAALAVALLAGQASLAAQVRTVLAGATLLDGSGRPAVHASRVVVQGDTIACVSDASGCPARPGDRLVALEGHWLMPGLIDGHVHLRFDDTAKAHDELRQHFMFGVTTVRDADTRQVEAVLEAAPWAARPGIPVPQIVVAAQLLPEYAERLGVPLPALGAELARRGVTQIKIKNGTRWRADLRTARELGLVAYGHTWGFPPPHAFLREALTEGIGGVVHLMSFALSSQPDGTSLTPPAVAIDEWAWHKALFTTMRRDALESLIKEMVARGAWLEPTLAAEYVWGREIPLPPAARFVGRPPGLRELVRGGPRPLSPKYPGAWTAQEDLVRRFHEAGGTLVAGSDDLEPGVGLHEEMYRIAEATGDPMAGIVAATAAAARALGRGDLGVVRAGATADLVVTHADPRDGPASSLDVTHVMKGGVLYDASALRAAAMSAYDASVQGAWRRRIVLGGCVLLGVGAAAVVAWRVLRRRPDGNDHPPPAVRHASTSGGAPA